MRKIQIQHHEHAGLGVHDNHGKVDRRGPQSAGQWNETPLIVLDDRKCVVAKGCMGGRATRAAVSSKPTFLERRAWSLSPVGDDNWNRAGLSSLDRLALKVCDRQGCPRGARTAP